MSEVTVWNFQVVSTYYYWLFSALGFRVWNSTSFPNYL